MWIALAVVVAVLVVTVVYDVVQRKHAILRNFPVLGHFRYLFESVGPELRQYIVTNNDEERPFSRDQRRWVYASSKKENNYFGFGTDNDLEMAPSYLIIRHDSLPSVRGTVAPRAPGVFSLPCAKILGAARGRAGAFRPDSVVNISGMSFGSLSSTAVEALSRGSQIAGCLYNTGEGGIAPYALQGADVVWQIGTGYFGCRTSTGQFDLDRFKEQVATNRIRAVEIKLSQGAKPGLGGVLPGVKVTPEIARIRGVPAGEDCVSPASHSAFCDADSLLDFVELLAAESGLPIGIKAAVGDMRSWEELAGLMETTDRGVDFITIDGGEGGTGAAPLTFADHVGLPFKIGFARVYRVFAARGLQERVVFVGSGKLGFPESALLAFALGCDLVNVGREAMLAVGCIQAQRCHTGHCPTGVATQNRWLIRGLEPTGKSVRLANYIETLRKELLLLSRACGVSHPALVTGARLELLDDRFGSRTVEDIFGYQPGWGQPGGSDRAAITEIMDATDPHSRRAS